MKGKITLFCAFLIASEAFCQVSLLPDFLQTSSNFTSEEAARQPITSFIADLQQRQGKYANDQHFLKFAFQKTQQRFLKKYEAYVPFASLFSDGRYDCLTATALYSVILGELGFDYHIIETNYHIFMMVKTATGEVLLETTDRLNGFVVNPDEIKQRTNTYRQTNRVKSASAAKQVKYQFHFDLYRVVEPRNLTGLLWYNRAIVAFNQSRWEQSVGFLQQANFIYASLRVSELADLLALVIRESGLSDQTQVRLENDLSKLTTRQILSASLH